MAKFVLCDVRFDALGGLSFVWAFSSHPIRKQLIGGMANHKPVLEGYKDPSKNFSRLLKHRISLTPVVGYERGKERECVIFCVCEKE